MTLFIELENGTEQKLEHVLGFATSGRFLGVVYEKHYHGQETFHNISTVKNYDIAHIEDLLN